VDVTVLGYVTVLRNGVGLIVLLLGVGSVFRWLDQHLPHSTDARAERGEPTAGLCAGSPGRS